MKDCRSCKLGTLKGEKAKPRRMCLMNRQSPGDVLVLTAAIESLEKKYPGQYRISIQTSVPAIFEYNPHIYPLGAKEDVLFVEMEYNLIHSCNQRPVHFMQGFTEHLGEVLGIDLPLLVNKPYIYLDEKETKWISQVQEVAGEKFPYWVVNAGIKNDFTAKYWGRKNYQRLVDKLKGKIRFVQIGSLEPTHYHPSLKGVIDLRGKTDTRQLIRLCWNAQGGVGPTTFIQHIFAAFGKPYVCLLGGREPLSWVHYPTQITLDSLGRISCCQTTSCWKSRTVPLGDGDKKDKDPCLFPVGSEPIPRCMEMISPNMVAASILSFYQGGILS